MIKLNRTIALVLFLIFANVADSQKLHIKNYGIGYRIFEMNSVGNNPTTIAPFLKNPAAYNRFLSTMEYNAISGSPGIHQLHTLYVNTELQIDSAIFRFWKKHTIQAGLLLTTSLRRGVGALSNQYFDFSPDTVMYDDRYSLVNKQQFLGGEIGINRRFNISKRLKAFLGLHAQGSFAIVNFYRQQLDSISFSSRRGRNLHSTSMPDLPGKKFFQWQAMVPIGLEYELYQKKLFIRLEFDPGIVGSRYISRDFAQKEAHGAGFFLVYHPDWGK